MHSYNLLTTDVPAFKPLVKQGEDGFVDIKKWDGRTCQLPNNWECLFESDEITFQLKILKGFKTDGGSIPKAFQNIIAPFGKGIFGFTVHDAFYGTYYVDRYIADNLLYAINDLSGMGVFKRNSVYYSLRAGGGFAWDNKVQSERHTKGIHPFHGIYKTRKYVDFKIINVCDKWKERIDKMDKMVLANHP